MPDEHQPWTSRAAKKSNAGREKRKLYRFARPWSSRAGAQGRARGSTLAIDAL
jgi:hypothetical protein